MIRTRMLIIAAFFAVASLPAFSAVEYDYRETGGGTDLHAVNTGAPLIATKAYSRAEILYKYEYTTLAAGNMITQLTYRGYNPGDSFTRHFVVWMENTQQRDMSDQYDLTPTTSMTKVFEGDCAIPSGGTAEDRIPLLMIPFSTPFMYNGNTNSLRVVIESTGEAASQDVCFEHGNIKRLCICATAEEENDNMEWESAQFPLTTLTAATEVVYQTGQVIDQDGCSVPDAKVKMDSWSAGYHIVYENSTNDNGKYSIRIGEGERYYSARVSAPGHASYIDNFSMLAKENPVRNFMLRNAIYYKAGHKATIIMPTAPSGSWGKYFRMERMDGNRLIFERELSPKANVPYIIIPEKDFTVDLRDLDMSTEPDTVTLAGWLDENNRYSYKIKFVGSFTNRNFFTTDNESCLFFDDEAECGWEERTDYNNHIRFIPRIGTLHACIIVDKVYDIEVEYHDQTNRVTSHASNTDNNPNHLYDLQGRRIQGEPQGKGVYIRNGKKYVMK
ncbi:MAG: carboxypeptidase-like regulatory domain-containing protein [Prevotella sp.]|nr:carboxypeptidase-like regulatory domain-containing protein [Prevotella sp.]